MGLDFVAIDFETATNVHSSACAIGIAVVQNGRVIDSTRHLIRPPRRGFKLSWIHGLSWEDVRNAPDFEELWHQLRRELKSEVLVAHNAAFDKAVLTECLRHYHIRYNLNPFLCSQQLVKRAFGFKRSNLKYLCKRLDIALQHHEPKSDARAAARLTIKAARKLELLDAKKLLQVCSK